MDDNNNSIVPVICGPTGAGKTRVAHWLAEQFPLSIVSADSRQVYREFDVGTAKPTPEELAHVPYLGVNVLEPTQRGSAAWWAENADRWISEIKGTGRRPLVVGGTGLYLRALFAPLFDEPALDPDRRSKLERELSAFTVNELRRWASALDPERAHLGRTQLLRAIEIALLTGQRLSVLHTQRARAPLRRGRYLVVDPGASLRTDIATRTRAMFDAGWRSEVRELMARVPADAPAWNGTGYRTIRALEEGMLTEKDAEAQIVTETRQYAKRQRTWFRNQLLGDDVTRVSLADNEWMRIAANWWAGNA